MKRDKRANQYNPQLDKNLTTALCNRFRDHYRFLGGEEITRFIVEDILKVVDQYRRPLSEVKKGQIVWDAAEIKQARKPGYGLKMKETKVKPIILTLISEEDIHKRKKGVPLREIRKDIIERIYNEAKKQGSTLNHIDGSLLLICFPTTIDKLIKELEHEKKIQIPDRGKIHDMGCSVSHKREICRLALQHYSQPDIQRRTHHSGDAVDRYLRDYNRVKMLKDAHSPQQIALITGLSHKLVKAYLELVEELEGDPKPDDDAK